MNKRKAFKISIIFYQSCEGKASEHINGARHENSLTNASLLKVVLKLINKIVSLVYDIYNFSECQRSNLQHIIDNFLTQNKKFVPFSLKF